MKPIRISERTRQQLDKLPPEKRAKAEEAIARTQTPEFRAQVAADRAVLDREYRETGRIRTIEEFVPKAELERLKSFLATLRTQREARGLSLADVAERSGIDKAALSRLENGQQINPTAFTLARYANAVGKRLTLALDDQPAEAGSSR